MENNAAKRKDYRLAGACVLGFLLLLGLNIWFDMRNPGWAIIDLLAITAAAVLLFRKYRRRE